MQRFGLCPPQLVPLSAAGTRQVIHSFVVSIVAQWARGRPDTRAKIWGRPKSFSSFGQLSPKVAAAI